LNQTLVIGIGNIFRGDDAVGLVAARRLREMWLPAVQVLEFDGDITTIAESWQGAPKVIVIDAATSRSAAGAIFRFEAHAEPLPRKLFATCCSCHALGLAHQIELSRALSQLPPCLIVYGVEGTDFTLGSGLSPGVAGAVDELIRRVLAEISPAVPSEMQGHGASPP
jgi:hydrogenase maturation protease